MGAFPLWLLPIVAISRYGYFQLRLLPIMAATHYGYTSHYGYFMTEVPVKALPSYLYLPFWLLPGISNCRYGFFLLWPLPAIAIAIMATLYSCYDYSLIAVLKIVLLWLLF